MRELCFSFFFFFFLFFFTEEAKDESTGIPALREGRQALGEWPRLQIKTHKSNKCVQIVPDGQEPASGIGYPDQAAGKAKRKGNTACEPRIFGKDGIPSTV